MTRSHVLIFILLSVGAVSAASAACGGVGFDSAFYGYTYLRSPGENTPASLASTFWALGFGNPAPGLGHDNGAWEDDEATPTYGDGWLHPFGTESWIQGDWTASAEIDGCILGNVAPGKPREIMVAAFSDQGYSGSAGFFAVVAAARNLAPHPPFEFTFPGVPRMDLISIPRIVIQSTGVLPSGVVTVGLRGPSLADVDPGVLTDGSVTAGELVAGYRVYRQAEGAGGPAPSDRRRDSGWILSSQTIPLGQNTTLELTDGCGHTYFASSLVFESGFETEHVSSNTPPIQTHICDPAYDFDGDGYNPNPCCSSTPDCDDSDPDIHPFAEEVCNGVDDDCDRLTDENVDGVDTDSDGVPNACDVCVTAPDPRQHDLDQDGEGDACDLDDGLILLGFPHRLEVSWQPEAGYLYWNLYRGHLGVLAETGEYTQVPGANPLAGRTCDLIEPRSSDAFVPGAGLAAFFLVSGETVASEGSLGVDSHGIERANAHPCP